MEALTRDPASAPRRVPLRSDPWLFVRVLGALAVLAVGAVHLQQ
jgi:hypothetical protein